MIDFWLGVGLLLLVAAGFLWIPFVRGCHALREEDRTALNVALYEERVAQLHAQQVEGALGAAQVEAAHAEMARELLADTEGHAAPPTFNLGGPAPLMITLVVPAFALGLYLHFGAREQVELARELAQPPSSLAAMTDRLERAVAIQPESAQSAYSLAQNYRAQGRSSDAAKMFERTVSLAGRRPELLGRWAEALYFSNGQKWSATIQSLTAEALVNDPGERVSLSLSGLAAFEQQRYRDALKYWNQAIATLSPDDPSRSALVEAIRQARENISKRR